MDSIISDENQSLNESLSKTEAAPSATTGGGVVEEQHLNNNQQLEQSSNNNHSLEENSNFWEGRGDDDDIQNNLPKPISLSDSPAKPPPSATERQQSHMSINNIDENQVKMTSEEGATSATTEPEHAVETHEEEKPPATTDNTNGVENENNKPPTPIHSSSRPVTPIHITDTSPLPSERLTRRTVKQGGGTSRRAGGASTNRSTTSIRQLDPYLSSINDMKYIGDQFVVGKTDPTLLSTFEQRFQRVYKPKTTKDANGGGGMTTSRSLDQSFNEFLRTKDKKSLSRPHFHSNDMKYTGDQFKVGKLDPKAVHPFEKRFQAKYKSKLQVLSPAQQVNGGGGPIKPVIGFNELKEMHDTLSVEHTSYRLKK